MSIMGKEKKAIKNKVRIITIQRGYALFHSPILKAVTQAKATKRKRSVSPMRTIAPFMNQPINGGNATKTIMVKISSLDASHQTSLVTPTTVATTRDPLGTTQINLTFNPQHRCTFIISSSNAAITPTTELQQRKAVTLQVGQFAL